MTGIVLNQLLPMPFRTPAAKMAEPINKQILAGGRIVLAGYPGSGKNTASTIIMSSTETPRTLAIVRDMSSIFVYDMKTERAQSHPCNAPGTPRESIAKVIGRALEEIGPDMVSFGEIHPEMADVVASIAGSYSFGILATIYMSKEDIAENNIPPHGKKLMAAGFRIIRTPLESYTGHCRIMK